MYETFFQLKTRPFSAAPRPEFYFPAESIEHTRQAVQRAVRRAAGPALIMGPSGSGKSLLCRVLARQFEPELLVANLASARLCTRRALLQNILFELNLPYRGIEEGELQLSLMDHLQTSKGLLLVVDEAHTLPLRLLEELRTFTNLVRDDQPIVQLVLAGAMSLEERFANPKLESFNQRVAVRGYLQPLTRSETVAYIHSQLERAGGNPDRLVTRNAIDAAFTAADGIPRLLNQLFDHALLLAAAGGRRQLDVDAIQEAWSDLQQLPIPWTQQNRDEEMHDVLEFGELDEQAAEVAWGTVLEQPDDDEVAATSLDERGNSQRPQVEQSTKESAESGSIPGNSGKTQEQQDGGNGTYANVDTNETCRKVTEDSVEAGAHSGQSLTAQPQTEDGSSPLPQQHQCLAAFDLGDPFGADFDDEEIIVDHYARLLSKPSSEAGELVDRESPAADQAADPEDGNAPDIIPGDMSGDIKPRVIISGGIMSGDTQPGVADSARPITYPLSIPTAVESSQSHNPVAWSPVEANERGPVDVIRLDDPSITVPSETVGDKSKDVVQLHVYRENELGSRPEPADDESFGERELADTVNELRQATLAQQDRSRVHVIRPKDVSEDDRDLIIVARRIPPAKSESGPSRHNYRQLFANLRDRAT